MFLAGIQAKFGLDPRLKHSGVTVLGVAHLLTPTAILVGEQDELFSRGERKHAKVAWDLCGNINASMRIGMQDGGVSGTLAAPSPPVRALFCLASVTGASGADYLPSRGPNPLLLRLQDRRQGSNFAGRREKGRRV